MSLNPIPRLCQTCARQITWRKKWERNWTNIIYCSSSCRRNKIRRNRDLGNVFEGGILAVLKEMKLGKKGFVTCEEVERWVMKGEDMVDNGDEGKLVFAKINDTREVIRNDTLVLPMNSQSSKIREKCRQAARRLAARGEIVITQKGKVTDPSFMKGVMELRLKGV